MNPIAQAQCFWRGVYAARVALAVRDFDRAGLFITQLCRIRSGWLYKHALREAMNLSRQIEELR